MAPRSSLRQTRTLIPRNLSLARSTPHLQTRPGAARAVAAALVPTRPGAIRLVAAVPEPTRALRRLTSAAMALAQALARTILYRALITLMVVPDLVQVMPRPALAVRALALDLVAPLSMYRALARSGDPAMACPTWAAQLAGPPPNGRPVAFRWLGEMREATPGALRALVEARLETAGELRPVVEVLPETAG